MPKALIASLRALEQHHYVAPGATQDTILKCDTSEVPADVKTILEGISVNARELFQVTNPPTRAQEDELRGCGFYVKWRSGLILTKKGWVSYR
jgi:hypothetical protein